MIKLREQWKGSTNFQPFKLSLEQEVLDLYQIGLGSINLDRMALTAETD